MYTDHHAVKVKICGLRSSDDARAVNAVLPDYTGFIFDSSRKRYIEPEKAERVRRLLDGRIRPVGVFVNAGVPEIMETLEICRLDMVQLHGEESNAMIRELREAYQKRWREQEENTIRPEQEKNTIRSELEKNTDRPVAEKHTAWPVTKENPKRPESGAEQRVSRSKRRRELCIVKAFRIDTEEDVKRAEASAADGILLDHGAGGTGESFDWNLLRNCRRPFFLAGGLTPDNVAEAVRRTRPYAVDVSSSLETNGRKDPEKIRRFMAAVRRMDER